MLILRRLRASSSSLRRAAQFTECSVIIINNNFLQMASAARTNNKKKKQAPATQPKTKWQKALDTDSEWEKVANGHQNLTSFMCLGGGGLID